MRRRILDENGIYIILTIGEHITSVKITIGEETVTFTEQGTYKIPIKKGSDFNISITPETDYTSSVNSSIYRNITETKYFDIYGKETYLFYTVYIPLGIQKVRFVYTGEDSLESIWERTGLSDNHYWTVNNGGGTLKFDGSRKLEWEVLEVHPSFVCENPTGSLTVNLVSTQYGQLCSDRVYCPIICYYPYTWNNEPYVEIKDVKLSTCFYDKSDPSLKGDMVQLSSITLPSGQHLLTDDDNKLLQKASSWYGGYSPDIKDTDDAFLTLAKYKNVYGLCIITEDLTKSVFFSLGINAINFENCAKNFISRDEIITSIVNSSWVYTYNPYTTGGHNNVISMATTWPTVYNSTTGIIRTIYD